MGATIPHEDDSHRLAHPPRCWNPLVLAAPLRQRDLACCPLLASYSTRGPDSAERRTLLLRHSPLAPSLSFSLPLSRPYDTFPPSPNPAPCSFAAWVIEAFTTRCLHETSRLALLPFSLFSHFPLLPPAYAAVLQKNGPLISQVSQFLSRYLPLLSLSVLLSLSLSSGPSSSSPPPSSSPLTRPFVSSSSCHQTTWSPLLPTISSLWAGP